MATFDASFLFWVRNVSCTLVPKCLRHFGTGAEVSLGHFGTSEKIRDTSAPNTWCRNVLGPKCLRSEVSVHVHPPCKCAL